MRFCLIIRIMKNICTEESATLIDTGSAEAAIKLVEYFREMETALFVYPYPAISINGSLNSSTLCPTTSGLRIAIDIGRSLGMSESTVKRFLKKLCPFQKRRTRTLYKNVM